MLSDERLLELSQILRHHECAVEELYIKTNTFGSVHLGKCIDALKENMSIKLLVLEAVEIVGSEFNEVFDALVLHPMLEDLQMKNCVISISSS